jgi:hypothetical protein
MNLEKLVSISGKSGIYRMVANRPNGLIVEDLDNGKRSFVAARMHQFTPLESISIYTEDEEQTVELKHVFHTMLMTKEETPLVEGKASANDTRNYFEFILPNHDREKVLISDIKKIVKWFQFLDARNMLSLIEETDEEEVEAVEEDNNEN